MLPECLRLKGFCSLCWCWVSLRALLNSPPRDAECKSDLSEPMYPGDDGVPPIDPKLDDHPRPEPNTERDLGLDITSPNDGRKLTSSSS
mmetsp:Transcript_18680/g.36602  ORF Transcript_18680/g.36602 Transcript_18680/m.36602 type:complete len:89 (+) Transcript_18680:492-758(+)